jgi:D-xylose transport system substrate-binding protein
MIKRIITLMLSLLIIAGSNAQDSLKIGFSVGDFSSDRWSQEPQIFNEAAKSLGAKVLFEYAYGDAAKQLSQAGMLIAAGVKVLVIFPTSAENWEGIIALAHKSGVKVVAYERMLKNADVDYYFSFYNEDVGRQQAKYAVEHCPKGNYLLLEGPTNDINSFLFLKGQKEILQPYIDRGDIKVVLEKHLDTWNSIDAYNMVQSFIEKNKIPINAIVAANDELAGGSIMALEMAQTAGNVIITGQDATVGGCQNILDGKQSMTVYKSIRNLATQAAIACVKLARDEAASNINSVMSNGKKDIPAMLLKTVVVDKNNMKQTVIAEGYLKAEQLHFGQ